MVVSLSGIVPGRHEFKVTKGDWSWSYPASNSWFYADAFGESQSRSTQTPCRTAGNPRSIAWVWAPMKNSWTIAGGLQWLEQCRPELCDDDRWRRDSCADSVAGARHLSIQTRCNGYVGFDQYRRATNKHCQHERYR